MRSEGARESKLIEKRKIGIVVEEAVLGLEIGITLEDEFNNVTTLVLTPPACMY